MKQTAQLYAAFLAGVFALAGLAYWYYKQNPWGGEDELHEPGTE